MHRDGDGRERGWEVQRFADRFVDLQGARHQADYALDGRQTKPDVLAVISAAEMAISWLEDADARHRRRFAAHVLFKRRPSAHKRIRDGGSI